MEVQSTANGLFIWQVTLVVVVGLLVYSFVDLSRKPWPVKQKMVWTIFLLLVPVLAGIIYLVKYKPYNLK